LISGKLPEFFVVAETTGSCCDLDRGLDTFSLPTQKPHRTIVLEYSLPPLSTERSSCDVATRAEAMASSAAWTIVHREDASSDHSNDINALRNALEKGNEDTKIQTMQKILVIMLNGDPLPGLLMHVIRFVHNLLRPCQ